MEPMRFDDTPARADGAAGSGDEHRGTGAWRVERVSMIGALSAAQRSELTLQNLVLAAEAVADVDIDGLEPTERRQWLEGLERARRMIEAASMSAMGELETSNPFRAQGFLSPRTVVTHMLQLSGPEAHRRLQAARLLTRLDDWRQAATAGAVGVAQVELMARVAANPRIGDPVLLRDQAQLLDDARTLPYDEFERRLRTWEALADPDGDRDRNERAKAARDVTLRPRGDYGWRLDGALPELDGAELNEVLAWFIEAEWQRDWHDVRARLGDGATVADLRRTEPQRRADALVAMAKAAATAPTGPRRSTTTVNVLIDHESFEAHLRGDRRDPADYRVVVCRTQRGRRLHPDDAVNAALVGYVRRVVYDAQKTVIELGRRSRLFRGTSRQAVMLLATVCAWVGCDRPVAWCDADHSRSWRAHGATVPRNGGPLCECHNHLKERGFQVVRDADGDWHTYDPDGNEVR